MLANLKEIRPKADVDDRRLGERQLEHRADEQAVGLDREELLVAVDDPRGVGDRVRREEHVVERPGLHPRRQGAEVGPMVQADHPSEAGPEDAEGDVHLELPEHEDQERPAVGAVRPLRGDQGDRLDAEGDDLELESARVLAVLGVDVEVAAALDRPDVEGEADALRRQELDEVADVADAVGDGPEIEGSADLVDRRLERPELEGEAAADLERRVGRQLELQGDELHREDAEERGSHRQVDLQAGAAVEAHAVGCVGDQAQLERHLDRAARQLREEAVAVAAGR